MSALSPSNEILIIDDDPASQEVLARYLGEQGFKVLVASDDKMGLTIARSAHPALILLDVSMPGRDGFETCRRLKADETTRDIPVIVMIALTATEDKSTAFQAGAVDYITRPFQREDVLVRVSAHLRMQRLMRELQEAEARLRVLIDNLPFEFWAMDGSLRYSMQNAVSRTNFGDVVGKRVEELGLPPEVAALWLEQDTRVLRGEVLGGEYERTLAGEKRAYENLVAPVIVDEAVVGIVGVAMDVTGRKRAEEERESVLEELEELETIINRSPAVVFLWRAAEGWPVEYVSDNVSQFGYTPADFRSGRIPYTRIVHPDDLERVAAEVSRYSREGRDEFVQEYRILTASGEVLWLDDRTWVRRDSNGTITHYQGIVIDVTERKRAEEALQKAHAELERRVEERTAELAQANRMLNILSACNQAVVRAMEEPALLQEICRIIVDVGGYPLVWIGFAEEDAARTVRPVAQSGFEEGYLDTVDHYLGRYRARSRADRHGHSFGQAQHRQGYPDRPRLRPLAGRGGQARLCIVHRAAPAGRRPGLRRTEHLCRGAGCLPRRRSTSAQGAGRRSGVRHHVSAGTGCAQPGGKGAEGERGALPVPCRAHAGCRHRTPGRHHRLRESCRRPDWRREES